MPLLVQKFGGTSVADADRIRACAKRIVETKQSAGANVVVVVSAMGHTTDHLLELAELAATPAAPPAHHPTTGQQRHSTEPEQAQPDRRELDMLLATGEQVTIALMAMAIRSLGVDAVSLTGPQCGIRTDGVHGRARITDITSDRLRAELAAGRIPVVAGFQGLSERGEITTLGRGGSDTTAVAVAAALGADACEIYTDVDGVFTADPRIVPDAQLRERISYDEMMEAASLGAKVMHLRAVEVGKNHRVPIHVRHSMRPGRGTMIVEEDASMERQAVSSVVLSSDVGRVTVLNLPNRPGVQDALFAPIAAANISVDEIIQNEIDDQHVNIAFTVDRADIAEVRDILERAISGSADGRILLETGLSKVSAVGVGMRSHSGVAATMFHALSEAGIRIANITTSEIRISCLIPEGDGPRAAKAIHSAFHLDAATAPTNG